MNVGHFFLEHKTGTFSFSGRALKEIWIAVFATDEINTVRKWTEENLSWHYFPLAPHGLFSTQYEYYILYTDNAEDAIKLELQFG